MLVAAILFPPSIIPPVWSSVLILATLVLIFAASWITFGILSHRSTTQRYWVTLWEWGRERKIRLRPGATRIPPPIDTVSVQRLEIRATLSGRHTTLVQFQSFSPVGAANPGDREIREGLWHVLLRDLKTPWPPTGLRPTGAASSVLDLFSLTSFPLLGASERFVVYGTESKAAASLTRSSARGLLPPDIGLLLHGKTLVLDFSDRPFDTVEFDRMIAVADQIVDHLPLANSAE